MSDQKVFIVLKNPEWDNMKPGKSHLFSKSYLTDGSQKLLEEVANEGLEYMQKGLVYDEEFTFFYWTYTGKGSFIHVFVTPDLFDDVRAWEDFRNWLGETIIAWANANKLPVKVERDKERQFYLKFTISVPMTEVKTATV